MGGMSWLIEWTVKKKRRFYKHQLRSKNIFVQLCKTHKNAK